jgi:hypothetical protein
MNWKHMMLSQPGEGQLLWLHRAHPERSGFPGPPKLQPRHAKSFWVSETCDLPSLSLVPARGGVAADAQLGVGLPVARVVRRQTDRKPSASSVALQIIDDILFLGGLSLRYQDCGMQFLHFSLLFLHSPTSPSFPSSNIQIRTPFPSITSLMRAEATPLR